MKNYLFRKISLKYQCPYGCLSANTTPASLVKWVKVLKTGLHLLLFKNNFSLFLQFKNTLKRKKNCRYLNSLTYNSKGTADSQCAIAWSLIMFPVCHSSPREVAMQVLTSGWSTLRNQGITNTHSFSHDNCNGMNWITVFNLAFFQRQPN